MPNKTKRVYTVSPIDMDVITPKIHRHRCRSIIHEFCLNTSVSALPNIARSENIYNRIFWSIAFLGASGLMMYFIVTIILIYFQYRTNTNVVITANWPQYFPSVSLCNIGEIRFDQFIGSFLNYTNALNLTNTNDTTTFSQFQANYIQSFIIDRINRNESMLPFFYSLSSMLYTCSFNSVPCSVTDFIPFTTSAYGLCYTFNARLRNSSADSVRYINQDGGVGKLELGIYLHSQQYVPYYVDNVGIVVLVHDNAEAPIMDPFGLNLIPGRKHKLGYGKETTLFLPSPYTSCTNQVSSSMKVMLAYYPNADYQYSQYFCFRLALQIYTYEQCGCVNPINWDIRSLVLPGTNNVIVVPLCNITDTCFIRAAETYNISSSSPSQSGLDCPQQCTMIDFIVAQSASLTPLEWQMDSIKTFVENSSVPLPANWSTIWREYIHGNYLDVSVVRETNVVNNIVQAPAFDLNNMISNIGGQTGLWLGISFLSLVEGIELIYRLICYLLQGILHMIRKKQ